MEELYSKIAPQRRRYELVSDEIQRFIVENHYKEGDVLPTERRLTELLGVSRTVVRESFKILAQKGLLDIRPGRGAFVTKPSTGIIGDLLSLHLSFTAGDSLDQLVEIRRTLEVEIVGLAARRRTKAELKKLEENVRTMIEFRHDNARCNQADLEFHLNLAAATQNELFGILLEPVRGLLYQAMTQVYHVARATEEAIRHHQEILECVRAADEQKARAAMRSHLDQFERVLKKSVAMAAQQDGKRQKNAKQNGTRKRAAAVR